MTILVGILCEDGVVIGADSAATFTIGEHKTIEQPTRKISLIGDNLIIATAGSGGLGQRFIEVAEKLHKTKAFSDATQAESARTLCREAWDNYKSTYIPYGDAPFGSLVAFSKSGLCCLFEYELGTLQPEEKNKNLWYVSMGSGQLIVDPFLGFMRRVFCPKSPPKLSLGIFMVTWALSHAIEVNPGGIQGPMQIAVLGSDGKGKYRARLLGEDDLVEHEENVKSIYDYISKYPDMLSGKDAPIIPD